MEIMKKQEDKTLTVSLTGRLDTTTAPMLESALKGNLENVTDLRLDFAGLEYVSSAGLRVLLAAQKVMNAQGTMVIENACEDIKEVFEITGFNDILTVR